MKGGKIHVLSGMWTEITGGSKALSILRSNGGSRSAAGTGRNLFEAGRGKRAGGSVLSGSGGSGRGDTAAQETKAKRTPHSSRAGSRASIARMGQA